MKTSLNELLKRLSKNEHDKLSDKLIEIAKDKGYVAKYQFTDGTIPDVLYLNNNGEIFLGDAKDAENETVSNKETTERIAGYIKSFFEYQKKNNKRMGYIAIITNDLDAALGWKDWLNDYCITKAMVSFEVFSLLSGAFLIINE